MAHRVLNIFVYIIFILFSATEAYAKQNQHIPSSPSVSIQSTGTITIPAEFIRFTVNISVFNKDLNDAFSQHKQQEAFLAELIKQNSFNDGDLIFNPISISATRNPRMEDGFNTRQVIIFSVTDFDLFESVQKTLIENGFTNLNGRFGANQTEEHKNEALLKAMENARAKASIIALSAQKRLGEVISVNYGSGSMQPVAYRDMAFDAQIAGQLSEFEQTITISENVNVTFELN